MIDMTSILRRRGDVRYRLLDGEAVVLRQRVGEVLVLNEVAARLLDLADGATPVAGWVEALAAEYEVERGALERDVILFAGELTSAEIVEIVEPVELRGGLP